MADSDPESDISVPFPSPRRSQYPLPPGLRSGSSATTTATTSRHGRQFAASSVARMQQQDDQHVQVLCDGFDNLGLQSQLGRRQHERMGAHALSHGTENDDDDDDDDDAAIWTPGVSQIHVHRDEHDYFAAAALAADDDDGDENGDDQGEGDPLAMIDRAIGAVMDAPDNAYALSYHARAVVGAAADGSTEKKLSMIEEVTEHATTASGQQSMAAILLQHHNHNTSHGSSGHGSSSYAMTPSRAARSPLSQQRASARPSPPPALAAIPPAHMFPSSMYSSGTTVRESRRSQRDGGGGLVARAATPTRRDAGSPPSSAAAPPSAAMPPLLDTPYMRLFQPDVGSWDEGRTPTRRPRSRSPELTFGDLAVDESGSNSVAERPTASASQQQRQQRNSASSATSSDPRHKSSSRDRPAPPDAPQSTSLSHSHQASRFGSRSALPRSLSIFAPASQQQQQKQEQPTLDDDVVIVGLTTADLGPLPDPEDHPHGPQDPLGVMAPSYEDIRVSAADYSSTDDSTGRIDSLHHQAEEEEEEDRSGAAMDETMSSGVSTLHHGRDAARQPLPLDQGGTPRNGTPPSSPRAISGLSSPEPSPVATPVRPSQPPVASSDPQTPAAQLTMTAVKRHIEARLAAEETPMPLHDALLSLENVSFFGDKDDQRAGAGESPPAPAPWSLRSESPPPPLNFGERLAMLMRATHGDRSPLALPPTSHSTAANTNVVHSGASEPSLSSLHSSTVGRSLTPTPTKPTPATAKSTAFAGRRSSPPPMITPLQDPPYVMPPDTPASAGPRSHDAPPTTSSPPHDEPVHGQLAQALLALMGGRPVWSTLAHVAELDLSGFDLDTLEGLDKCAPHLSWLRCVRSRLRYLEGTPTTVTHLAVADNRLSTLTSLHHLAGLQELDISGNHVDDLIGCAHLPHLRVLKADRNGIASWAAVPGMRALQVLHLRGNRIASLGGDEEVHGGAAMWPALVELDLTGNQVETVSDSLDVAMPKLRTLVLDANGLLGTFLGRHARVQSLSLADNLVTQVADVATHWPSLRRINLDGNQVRSLDLSDLDSVDHVQLACQSHLLPPTRSSLFASSTDKDTESNDDDSFDYSTLQTAARLSLRNNPRLPPLDRMTHMYQLVHLDLAGCGIRALPTRMARHVPALRRLDLSQNCLSDLAPVAKMRRLRWLSLRSNDVGDFFQAVGYLGHLTRLEVLDLRQNPLTALFYPNLVMSPPGVSSHHPHPVDVNEDDDEKAAWAVADQQYQEQQLNDSTLVKRACYRTAVLYHLRASLRELDWIAITADQRAGAPARYARMERSLAQVMARSGPRSSSTAAPPAKQSDSAVTKPVPLSRPSRSSQPAVPATPLPPPPLPPPQRLGLGATEASTPATVTTEWTPTSGAGGSTTMVPPTLLTAGGSVATTPSSTATTTAETTAAATPLLNSATFVVPTSKGNASHDDHTHLTRSDITTETAILAELAELVAGTYSEQQQQRHQGSSGSDSNKGALPHEHQVRGQPLMAPPSPCGTVIAPSFSHLSK